MEIISSLFILWFLSEYAWASTNSTTVPVESQTLDILPMTHSSSNLYLTPSQPFLDLATGLLEASDPKTTLSPSLQESVKPLIAQGSKAQNTEVSSDLLENITTEVSTPNTEVETSTTPSPTTPGLTPVKKETPSSTQELTTLPSIPAELTTSLRDAVVMATTIPPISPPLDTTPGEETTTLVIKKITSSEVTSASMTTSTTVSFEDSQISKTTSPSSTSSTNESPNKLQQDGGNPLLVILVVVFVAVILLVVLFLLWRHRQKRRTGALMLVGNGKHKGAEDAWAGPVQVSEDQVASGSAAVEGDTGLSEGKGNGQRPTLTTFFGKRKSRQGSVMLKDLEAGAATCNLKEEAEPLVENVNGAIKTPETDDSVDDGSIAGDGNLPPAPVTNV